MSRETWDYEMRLPTRGTRGADKPWLSESARKMLPAEPRALTHEEEVAAVMASPWVKPADKPKIIASLAKGSPSAHQYVFALYARQKGMA